MAFWAGIILFFSVIMFLTFVLYTLMCLTYIGRPLLTVKIPLWQKRDILLGPCLENMTPGYYLRSTH